MSGMRSLSVGVTLLSLFPIYIHAQSIQLVHSLDKINGVLKGKTLQLDVSYTYGGSKIVQVTWKFEGTEIVSKVGANLQSSNPRATIRGNAALVLNNTELSDNGTYTIEVGFFGGATIDMASFEVIIQVPPTIQTSCSGTITLKEGENLNCSCEGINGNPPAVVLWSKDGQPYGKREDLMQPLVLRNVSRSHCGTYTCTARSYNLEKSKSFTLVVNSSIRPKAKALCSGKGDYVCCWCEGTGGNPPAYTTWWKRNTKIKGPEYLSATMETKDIIYNKEGEYTCKANSDDLTDEDKITLSKPNEISFRSEIVSGEIKLVCKVVGTNITPAPVYLISFNGSKAKEYENGEKDIGTSVGRDEIGRYECLVKNVLGEVTKHLFLNETVIVTTSPSVVITTKEQEKIISDKSCNCGTDWYVFLITSLCGVIVGMMLMYAIMSLRLRLSKNSDQSKPPQPGAGVGPSGEGLENASAYQELDLQKMNKIDDNYQSLRMTSRNTRSNTAPDEIENEAGYQELNEVRGNTDDNYQPLNRV